MRKFSIDLAIVFVSLFGLCFMYLLIKGYSVKHIWDSLWGEWNEFSSNS